MSSLTASDSKEDERQLLLQYVELISNNGHRRFRHTTSATHAELYGPLIVILPSFRKKGENYHQRQDHGQSSIQQSNTLPQL
jgi:hypothetical protein